MNNAAFPNNGNGLFARLPGISTNEKEEGKTREFKGDGTAFLKVPGLKSVESVRVGHCTIPLETEQEFPDNTRPFGQATIKSRLPMLQIIADAEGTPILLRSQQSNDGNWQQGASIYITGEWEVEKPTGKPGDKPKTTGGTPSPSPGPAGESNGADSSK